MTRPNEDSNQFGIPSVHVVDDEKLVDGADPAHPTPPGGSLPDLNLAESPGFNVASGVSYQPMPTPVKPDIVWPTAFGNPDMGGTDPENPSPPAPNLAGVGGGVDFPEDGAIHQPDYMEPNWASMNKPLIGGSNDIASANLNYSYGSEFAPDPENPDLTDYCHPRGMDFHQITQADMFKPDPQTGDLIDYEQPGGIHVLDHPIDPDPQLPDLQDPQFSLDIQMQGRPGEMDPGALDEMKGPDYQEVKGVSYDKSYMVQGGSSRRSRHLDLMMHGLDGSL